MATLVRNGTAGDDRISIQSVVNIDLVLSEMYGGNDQFDGVGVRASVDGGAGNDLIYLLGGGEAQGGDGNDTLVIDLNAAPAAADNLADGGAGADRFVIGPGGGSQASSLFGGDGNDVFEDTRAGTGPRSLDAGAGFDMLFMPNAPDPVTAALAAGTVRGGTPGATAVAGFEGVGGGLGDDRLTGDDAANVLVGQLGADLLKGGGGDDLLIGSERPGLFWNQFTGENLEFFGTVSTDPFDCLSNNGVTGTAYDESANRLFGGGGNDVLLGGRGADELVGGSGSDWVSYAGFTQQVFADLAAGVGGQSSFLPSGADGLGDTGDALRQVENLWGSEQGDWLRGDGRNNSFAGNGGGDSLEGFAGADTLDGGLSNDRLAGGVGRDALTGGAGADQFVFDVANTADNADMIEDFDTTQDTILLDADIYGRLSPGLVPAASFAIGARATTSQVLAYDPATGRLTYDRDGSGASASAVLIVTLDTGLALASNDFLVV